MKSYTILQQRLFPFLVFPCRSFLAAHYKFSPRYFSMATNGNNAGVIMGERIERAKVLVTRILPKPAMDLIRESRHEVEIWPSDTFTMPRESLLEKVKGIHGLCCLLTDKVDRELLDAAGPNLKIVSIVSAGYDSVEVSELKKKGIMLGHTPDVLTESTAELGVALLIAAGRRLFEANMVAKNSGWKNWTILWMCGRGLNNSVVGIVGLGKIGLAVAKRILPFNVKKILYYNRRERPADAAEVGAEFVSFDRLLNESDFVLVSCSLNDDTRGMFDKSAFDKMKNSAVFVNISRGDVVKQEDLIEALQNGTIRAAGLDVVSPEPLPTDHILYKLDNCVVLPHVGSAEEPTRIAMAVLAVKNLLAALDGMPMPARAV